MSNEILEQINALPPEERAALLQDLTSGLPPEKIGEMVASAQLARVRAGEFRWSEGPLVRPWQLSFVEVKPYPIGCGKYPRVLARMDQGKLVFDFRELDVTQPQRDAGMIGGFVVTQFVSTFTTPVDFEAPLPSPAELLRSAKAILSYSGSVWISQGQGRVPAGQIRLSYDCAQGPRAILPDLSLHRVLVRYFRAYNSRQVGDRVEPTFMISDVLPVLRPVAPIVPGVAPENPEARDDQGLATDEAF